MKLLLANAPSYMARCIMLCVVMLIFYFYDSRSQMMILWIFLHRRGLVQ